MKKEIYMINKQVLSSSIEIFNLYSSICAMNNIIRINETRPGFYNCEKCALVDTINRNVGCPLIIKENLKGVK